MLNERHIRTSEGIIQGRKTAFKAALLLCASVLLNLLLLVPSVAFAQSHPNANEPPIVATTVLETPQNDTLSGDLQPETLKAPIASTLNQKDIKRRKKGRSNRWNTQTLTQTTGMNAASKRPAQPITGSHMQADILPPDLLSTEDFLLAGATPVLNIVKPLESTSHADKVINLSSSLRGALFDLPNAGNVTSVFKLDLGGRPCLGTTTACTANEIRRIDLGYAKNITKGKKNGFNLQITPHGGLLVDNNGQSAFVGALVRIGDNLREGSKMKSNTWYLFAGADAEALTYTPNSIRRLTSGDFHLQDRIIIGDAQVGVGYRIGDADFALTYYKRQAKAETYSYNEDAAALSITWKR